MGVFSLLLLLFVVPTAAGAAMFMGKEKDKGPIFWWITGQFLLWAVFQLITVPLILLEQPFSTVFSKALNYENPPWTVVTLFSVFVLCCLLAFTVRWAVVRKMGSAGKKAGKTPRLSPWNNKEPWELVLWGIFWALLLLQLVLAVCMTYGDGDDAFYVAVSTITEESNTMYRKLPYTGGSTCLDSRHGLAPFPVWIAYLARVSRIPAVTVAHVAVPLALIPMTYGIYDLLFRKLWKGAGEKRPLFLVLASLLVIFGDYSAGSVENFMIARSRQGKAALGSIVIPLMIYLFLMILERLQEKQKIEWYWWVLLAAGVLSGCLCSTLGALLLCMFTGIVGVLSAVCYRRLKHLLPMAICCLPAVCYALLYLLLE